jgi:protein involved in polysaccharide export with SLBB domain
MRFLLMLALISTSAFAQDTTPGQVSPVKKPTVLKPSPIDIDDLIEKQEMLQGELRYAKAKLNATERKLVAAISPGDAKELSRLSQEAKDWQARCDSTAAKLEQLEKEINDARVQIAEREKNAVLLPGEVVEISVTEAPAFDGRYQIRRGRYIILPQVGRVMIAGKNIADAEAAVQRALEATQVQHAVVKIERLPTGPKVFVKGEVLGPGRWQLPQNIEPTLVSLIQTLVPSKSADLTRVRVTHKNGEIEEVNVQKILDGEKLLPDLRLQENDLIEIPATRPAVTLLLGNDPTRRSIPLEDGKPLGVWAAIRQNGGLPRSSTNGIYVLRWMPDGSRARILVSIQKIRNGDLPDTPLQNGDVIVVPEKAFQF